MIRELLKRELLYLKQPSFIIGLVLIIVFYSAIGGSIGYSVETSMSQVSSIGVYIEDSSLATQSFINNLNKSLNYALHEVNSLSTTSGNQKIILIVPRGFGEELSKGLINLTVYRVVDRIGGVSSFADTVLSYMSKGLEESYYATFSNNGSLKKPTIKTSYVYNLEGYQVRESVYLLMQGLSASSMILAMLFFIAVPSAAQLVAAERIERTLEMLISQPIRRRDIIISKILGAAIISIVQGVVFAAAFILMGYLAAAPRITQTIPQYSDYNFTVVSGVGLRELLNLGMSFIILFVAFLVMGLFYSATLGALVGLLVSDERMLGLLITPVMLLLLFSGFIVMFIGLPIDPMIASVSGLAITPVLIYGVAGILLERYDLVIYPLISLSLAIIVLVYASIEIMNRDVVILGIGEGFRRRRLMT